MPKLIMTSCTFATNYQLFQFKKDPIKLPPFPGYAEDQWGIKAHNRPWIVKNSNFKKGMNVMEVGGGYSTLPKYLTKKYGVNSWVGDDFGNYCHESAIWTRWGNPKKLPLINKPVNYIFEPLGYFSKQYKDRFFDVIFSVSTLEHIPPSLRINVLKDINRCLKGGGIQLHTIDISTSINKVMNETLIEMLPFSQKIPKLLTEINKWVKLFEISGVKINAKIPKSYSLLDRTLLSESPDVVYRYYPPNNEPKQLSPSASLLVRIESV